MVAFDSCHLPDADVRLLILATSHAGLPEAVRTPLERGLRERAAALAAATGAGAPVQAAALADSQLRAGCRDALLRLPVAAAIAKGNWEHEMRRALVALMQSSKEASVRERALAAGAADGALARLRSHCPDAGTRCEAAVAASMLHSMRTSLMDAGGGLGFEAVLLMHRIVHLVFDTPGLGSNVRRAHRLIAARGSVRDANVLWELVGPNAD